MYEQNENIKQKTIGKYQTDSGPENTIIEFKNSLKRFNKLDQVEEKYW